MLGKKDVGEGWVLGEEVGFRVGGFRKVVRLYIKIRASSRNRVSFWFR